MDGMQFLLWKIPFYKEQNDKKGSKLKINSSNSGALNKHKLFLVAAPVLSRRQDTVQDVS